MKVVAFGTYDTGKPRVRLCLRGLRENGVEVIECHHPVWHQIEDKSQLKGLRARLRIAAKWALAYPRLLWKYLRLPKHDVLFIGYLGVMDVLLIWPFAKLRGTPIIWDVFLSLYNTIVEDRGMVGRRHPLALLCYAVEFIAMRAADVLLIDTQAHARYLQSTFLLSHHRVRSVFVGAEPEHFPAAETNDAAGFRVLFYGQFIPLHGIETVVRAAAECDDHDIEWVLIGKGQEAPRIRAMVEQLAPANLKWIEWIEYEELGLQLARCHVALGIFGSSNKAAMVIPNKVFQIIMAGRPLITADTPAARELLEPGPGIRLIPAADPKALLDAVMDMKRNYPREPEGGFHHAIRSTITPQAIGASLSHMLRQAMRPRGQGGSGCEWEAESDGGAAGSKGHHHAVGCGATDTPERVTRPRPPSLS